MRIKSDQSIHKAGFKLAIAVSSIVASSVMLTACQTNAVTPKSGGPSISIGEGFLPDTITAVSKQAIPEPASNDSIVAAQPKLLLGTDITAAPLASMDKKSWSKRGGDIALNFSNISVQDAAQLILGDQLGQSFSIDDDVRGLVSMNGQGGLHQDDLVPTLKALLGSVDAKLVQAGNSYRIVKGADTQSVRSTQDLDIIPLRYMGAGDFAAVLANHGVNASVIEDGNMVAVNASSKKLRQIRGLAKTFDVNWFKGQSIGFFPVENGTADEIRADLLSLFANKRDDRLGSLKLVAVNRSNSLMVVAPSQWAVKEVGRWVTQMDQQAGEAGQGFYVYRVKNGKATELAKLAGNMFNANRFTPQDDQMNMPASGASLVTQAGASSNELRIIADDATNSVIVSGSPYHFRQVKAAMKQLDTKPLQVLVEARIMELNLTGELQYGLEWFLRGSRASSSTNGSLDFNQGGPDLPIPGFNYVVERAGEIRGILNAFAEDSRLKVLSSPSLMVLNNRTARIQVGDEVPIPRAQSTSNFTPDAPTVNSIDYKDTGIVLQITPRINAGGMVTLDVTQEVSSVGRNTVSEIDAPIIQQRKLSSTIAVQSGQTVVLGGLIQERVSNSEAGVPVLKNIPGVGKLFSSSTENTRRTELVALLTPKVVKRQEDFARINQDYIESFRGLKEIRLDD